MTQVTKNYSTDGGDRMVIGGTLEFTAEGELEGFPGAANQASSTATQVAGLKNDFNALLVKLKNAGIMIPDAWNVSVKAAPNLPIADTAANSGHATVSIDGTDITIALDCKVSELADSDHGETWGTHKWIGFGVNSGLETVKGIVFNDGTASVTLGDDDVSEASSVGLNAGEFVLYIKAEKIAAQGGAFTLKADGYAETGFTMRITEPAVQA